jgi:hypothetical protein
VTCTKSSVRLLRQGKVRHCLEKRDSRGVDAGGEEEGDDRALDDGGDGGRVLFCGRDVV